MTQKKILVIDDEKNICLTMSIALQKNGYSADTAANGMEAFKLIEKNDYNLVITDLKMPGMDGIEILKKITELKPEIRVIIISAFGTIEKAVEAIKLGAIDFIPKPFSEDALIEQIKQIFERDTLSENTDMDYNKLINLAKKCINERRFDSAIAYIRKAVSLSIAKPDAFNILGVLYEAQGNDYEAQKNYRVAMDIEPAYKPARINLERSTSWKKHPQSQL